MICVFLAFPWSAAKGWSIIALAAPRAMTVQKDLHRGASCTEQTSLELDAWHNNLLVRIIYSYTLIHTHIIEPWSSLIMIAIATACNSNIRTVMDELHEVVLILFGHLHQGWVYGSLLKVQSRLTSAEASSKLSSETGTKSPVSGGSTVDLEHHTVDRFTTDWPPVSRRPGKLGGGI